MTEAGYERILIPLDGSQRAEEALTVGVDLARRFHSRVYLVAAFSMTGRLFLPEGSRPMPTHYKQLRQFEIEQITAFLAEKVAGFAQAGVTAESVVIEDDPADAIVKTAEDRDVDLIVMTSHGQRGWTRWISGSVTESVLRRAPCPVMVLRKGAPPEGGDE